MYPKLFQLYGSLCINSFGLCLAFSLIAFLYLVSKDRALPKLLSMDDVINVTIYTTIIGVISGRFLYIVTEFPHYNNFFDLLNVTSGGGSVLGSLIGSIVYLSIFAYRRNLPILEILDIAGIYTPIIHSISRVGCFLAGCCYGCESSLPWAITYTNPDTVAPLHVSIHPTQLYSAAIFFVMLLFMYFNFGKVKSKIPGLAFNCYLIFSSLERLFMDFIRGDRTFVFGYLGIFNVLSFHQIVAIVLLIAGLSYLVAVNFRRSTITV